MKPMRNHCRQDTTETCGVHVLKETVDQRLRSQIKSTSYLEPVGRLDDRLNEVVGSSGSIGGHHVRFTGEMEAIIPHRLRDRLEPGVG